MRTDAALPRATPTTTIAEPAGWAPAVISPGTSTRPDGLLQSGIAAWRGTPEAAAGTALTAPQVATLAPFLATQLGLDAAVVRGDLERVRVQIGGAAAGAGNVATTIGHHVYVSDAARAAQMLSWGGRGWLAHELVHTMQWRGSAAAQASDAARDRAFLNQYVGAYAAHDGKLDAGGFAQALRELARRHRENVPTGPIGDIIHDTHPMEQQASKVAKAFLDTTR